MHGVIRPARGPAPSVTTQVLCCTENTAGSCCQPNPNPRFKSSRTMLPRTRVPFGKCNGVVRLHALTTARTACSSDTDHSFVLGIVLDSCNRSEHASASGFSTWVLPRFTPAPTPRMFCCQGRAHRAHIPIRDSTLDHGRSHCSVPSTHLGSNTWSFPASPLLKSSIMMKRNQEILLRKDPRPSR